MKAAFTKHTLDFKNPSGTSRGILHQKETWYLVLSEEDKTGIGECSILRGLSLDDVPNFEKKLQWLCDNINCNRDELQNALIHFPSIQFGLEQAFLSLQNQDSFTLFTSPFTEGNDKVPINGLIWMGDKQFMLEQVKKKLQQGFTCIKIKIGAIEFTKELEILEFIRSAYSKDYIEIRVDANGAFNPKVANEMLNKLAAYDVHSIEQPIKAGQWSSMAKLCETSPVPIALDEELIGIFSNAQKESLLNLIKPAYIILKPSLLGGFKETEAWIRLAENYGIAWWVTSALESNIGLNAIAQWTYTLKNPLPQGLGTGSLFKNNIASPLTVKNGYLYIDKQKSWHLGRILNLCI